MNRRKAKEIAEKITNEELLQMFKNAKEKITDWKSVSICNSSFDKGAAWNILAKSFDVNYSYHRIAKTNMVREFGAYLSENNKPEKKIKPKIELHHQEPDFTNW